MDIVRRVSNQSAISFFESQKQRAANLQTSTNLPGADHDIPKTAAKVENRAAAQPSVYFQESLVSSEAERFKFCLVGKFAQTRPTLAATRKWVRDNWKLKGKWKISLLNASHLLLDLDNEDDMLRVWTKRKWVIEGRSMTVFKWTPSFPPSDEETPMAAVWVSFPCLPLVFFKEELLRSVASVVGKVQAIDNLTRNMHRIDVARAWVEVDLTKELPKKLWIGIGRGGFWQEIFHGKLPYYCTGCCQQGHLTSRCKLLARKRENELGPSALMNQNSHVGKAGLHDEWLSDIIWAQFRSLFQDVEEDNQPTTEGSKSAETKILGSSGVWSKDQRLHGNDSEKIEGKKATSANKRIKMETTSVETGGLQSKDLQIVHKGKQKQGEKTERLTILRDAKTENEVAMEKNCLEVQVAFDRKVKVKELVSHFENEQDDLLQPEATSYEAMKNLPRSPQRSVSSKILGQSEVDEAILDDHKPRQHSKKTNTSSYQSDWNYHVEKYSSSDIKKMTNSFSETIGRGGFGIVYKGTIREGHPVAVKVLTIKGAAKEFESEINIIKRSRHENIVRLLGFCSSFSARALVYDLMPNGSLDKYIEPPHSLPCQQLYQIALGVARGIQYLHHGSDTAILHLDIKPENILLDQDFCPKIADFGLATEWNTKKSKPSGAIKGTPGYIAPELFEGSKISLKSDVYSFGVMLLEMATGKRAKDAEVPGNLVRWALDEVNKQVASRNLLEETARKMMITALWCMQDDPEHRPGMRKVLPMLETPVRNFPWPAGTLSLGTHGGPPADSFELYVDRLCSGMLDRGVRNIQWPKSPLRSGTHRGLPLDSLELYT